MLSIDDDIEGIRRSLIRKEIRDADFLLRAFRQSFLCILNHSSQAAAQRAIVPCLQAGSSERCEIHARLLTQTLQEIIVQQTIEIIASQMMIAVRINGLIFLRLRISFKNAQIKRAAAKIDDQDLAIQILSSPCCHSCCHRFGNDAQNLKPCTLTGLSRFFLLLATEIGRHRNNSLDARILFLLHFFEHRLLYTTQNLSSCIRRGQRLPSLLPLLIRIAHERLGRTNQIIRVALSLNLGFMPDGQAAIRFHIEHRGQHFLAIKFEQRRLAFLHITSQSVRST